MPLGQGDFVQQYLLMSDLARCIQCPNTEVHPSRTRSPLSEMVLASHLSPVVLSIKFLGVQEAIPQHSRAAASPS